MEKEGYRETADRLAKKYGKEALSVKEAAAELGVSEWTLRQELKKKYGNPIPSRRIGRNRIVIPVAGLARWACDTRR